MTDAQMAERAGMAAPERGTRAKHHERMVAIRAALAARGFEIREVAGALVISQQGLLRVLDGHAALEDFARQVEATS